MGKVTASIDTGHYRGSISKSVRVTANDPARTALSLELKADIVSLIDVSPTENPIMRMTWGDLKPTELTVQATDKKPFAVLKVETDPQVTVTVRNAPGEPVVKARTKKGAPKPVAAGSSRYLVAITPTKNATVGQWVGNVDLITDRDKAEKVTIRPMITIAGPVQFDPVQILLRASPDGFQSTVKLKKPSGTPFDVLGVESADPDFTASTTPVKAGHEYDVLVKYTGKAGRGMIRSRITVKTSEPSQPTIVIPILGAL